MRTPNTSSLAAWWKQRLDVADADIVRSLRTFNAYADAFRRESQAHE
jgi:hypothetical protein